MISAERIEQVARIVTGAGLNEQTLSLLRANFRDLHFTCCEDDDVGAVGPVRMLPGCNIYLVDGRDPCLHLTADPEVATGLVLAAVTADP